jgi:hypothetical protein
MRTLVIVLALVIATPAFARTSRVVVVSEREPMSSALRLALANRSDVITSPQSPEGGLRLDRAASVQRVVVASQADAGVWIEETLGQIEVCAVSADGMYLQHAPLPEASPRVFAAIATSLLDELLAPRETAPAINVNVDVAVHPGAPGIVDAPPLAPMSRAHRTLVEIGPLASPATLGLEAELAFPVTPSWRLGLVGSGSVLIDGIGDMASGTRFYAGGLEVRHVGAGDNHLDIALRGGLGHGTAYGDGDTGEMASLQFSYVWDSPSSGVELSVAPMALSGFRGHDTIWGAMTSLRWELPL